MSESLDAYLEALKGALAGSDRALVQDALFDARNRLNRELARLSWEEPLLTSDQALAKAVTLLGTPEQAAEAYRQRETLVAEVLKPAPAPQEPERPWPSLFGVFKDPRAYTSVLYLLLSFVTGLFAFVWVVTGLSLSLSLLVILIGFPLLLFFLGSVRALGLAEGRLVEALLDVRMPRRPPLLPEGLKWTQRLANLFKDGYTWTSLLYLLLMLPLGIMHFTLSFSSFVMSFALMAVPFAKLCGDFGGEMVVFGKVYGPDVMPPLWILVGIAFLGILALAGSLHLALAQGRLQGWLARQLLVKR